jgi:hypothetical protein
MLLAPVSVAAAVPDFSGVWEADRPEGNNIDGPASSPEEIDAGYPPPPGGEPVLREPYLHEYQDLLEKKHVADEKGTPIADARAQCLPLGMPSVMYLLFPMEIVAAKDKIMVIAEEYSQVRHIYFNRLPPPADESVPTYNGFSTARWDGDTLVIQTTGVRVESRLWDIPHSENMVVTERWNMTGPDKMTNSIVMTDPTVLAKPYTFSLEYRRAKRDLMEYECENNRYGISEEGGHVFGN